MVVCVTNTVGRTDGMLRCAVRSYFFRSEEYNSLMAIGKRVRRLDSESHETMQGEAE